MRSAFSMSSGYTLKPLGRTMMSLIRPDRISRPAVVEVADVAGPVPAVRGERGRPSRRVVPVAAEHRRPLELDLAVVGDAHLDARRRPPDRAEAVVVAAACCCRSRSRSRRSPGGPSTPRSSQACWSAGGRNAPADRNSRNCPPSCAWTLPNRRGRRPIGQLPGDAAQAVERGLAAALVDLALDGAPEQVEDLRDDHHRGHPVVAQRVEDDPRVAAADVQDVRADRQRVVQADRLLEQVRQRQQRDDPVRPSAG